MTTLNAGIAAIPNGSPERARTYGWRTNVSLTFSFDMAILAVLGCAGSSILWWLTNERYPQLLALAGVAGLIAIGAGAYRILGAQQQTGWRLNTLFVVLVIGLCLLPVVVPVVMSTAVAALILVSIASQVVLESRWGIVFLVGCVLALLIDSLVAQALSTSLFAALRAPDFALAGIGPWLNAPALLGLVWVGGRFVGGWKSALAEERASLRLLIDNLPDYVYVKDTHSRMIINNVTHARLLGNSTPDQVVGKTDFDFFPKELAQKYFDDEQRILQSDQTTIHTEEPTTDAEGHLHWLLTTKVLFRDTKGNVAGIVGISRDVTTQRAAEQERDRLLEVEQEQRASLERMLAQLRDTARQLSEATVQILAATAQQATSATEQEATITQTTSTVEEIRMTVRQSAEHAQAVAEASRQAVNVARMGQDAAGEAAEGMRVIRARVESIAQTIMMLSQRTQQIGEIIATVNEIADQSKLLALNASIEAARAGQEGRGFSVVAMEVRQLAEQSRDATARVRNILNEIQQAANAAVKITEEGTSGTDMGMTLVERAAQSIQALAATVEDSAQTALQIAASTHQQTNGMDQLAASMNQIRMASTQTAASVRQMENSAQDLVTLAQQLTQTADAYAA